jgi:hypothetical protein
MNASTKIAMPQSFTEDVNIGRLGRCVNHANCDVALSGQVLVIEDRGRFLCPSCGGGLEAVSPLKARSRQGVSVVIMAGSFAAAAALGIAVAGMELAGTQGTTPAPSPQPAAPRVAAAPPPVAVPAPATRPVPLALPSRPAPAEAPVEEADLPIAIAPALPPQVQTTALRSPGTVFVRAAPVQARPLPAPRSPAAEPPTRFATLEPAPRVPGNEAALRPPSIETAPVKPAPQARPVALAPLVPAPAPVQPRIAPQDPTVVRPQAAASAPAPVKPAQPPVKSGPDRPFTPAAISGGQPSYPDLLLATATRGTVNVTCRIEPDGRPTACQAKTLRGHRAFSNAVTSWLSSGNVRFSPILRDGKPVAEQHSWNIEFDPPAD